jgi:hypothetical protein
MRWDGSTWRTVPSPNVQGVLANILADVTCVSSSECWAVGSYITKDVQVRSLIMRWNGSAWTIVESPNIGTTPWNGFNSVTCTSASQCWAVGFTTASTAKTMIVRWGGSGWALVDSPNASEQSNVLHGVTCLVASDCWAVGSFSPDGVTKRALTVHWNGSTWKVVASADAPAAQESVLSGISCVSSTACWAVGNSYNGANRQTLAERWDGTAWTTAITPNAVGPLDSYLVRVDCTSPTACWAVGHSNDTTTVDQRFIARWDGTLWTPTTLPDPLATEASALTGITCQSSSDCWAVGSLTSGTALALLTHWDGAAWNTVAGPRVGSPEDDHGYLQDVTCVTVADCWAVGFYFSGQVARTLTSHWDGSTWTIVESPNSAPDRNNYLAGVTCTSATSCWAVGRSTTTIDTERQPLALRWDGDSWSVVSTSLTDTSAARSDALEAVSCVSASECMAVGHANVDGRYVAFAMRWNGDGWREVPVPLRQDAETFYVPSDILYDVSCPASSDCWAVGAHWTGTVYQTLTVHWDGTTWTPVVSPSTAPDRGNILSGVSCPSAADCWAVGSSDDYEQALIEHWDGTSWTIAAAPQNGSILTAVSCVSTEECWAVGPYYSPHQRSVPLLARWNGTSWTPSASPTAGTQSQYLAGIACPSSEHCWAVGRSAGRRSQTLALRYAADGSPTPTVPQGRPWLIALAGVLLLGFAARRRRSAG